MSRGPQAVNGQQLT